MGSMSADQIYQNFKHARGTAMWQAGHDAANRMAQDMPDLAADVKRLQDSMRLAWQGTAADDAAQGAQPLALEYLNTADYLRSSQDLMNRQTGSFGTATNSVRPVPPMPTSVDVLGAVMGAPSMQQQVQGYLAASQHNVDVYTSYHGASQYNTTAMPVTFGHLATDNVTVTIASTPPTTPSGAGPVLLTTTTPGSDGTGGRSGGPPRPSSGGTTRGPAYQPSAQGEPATAAGMSGLSGSQPSPTPVTSTSAITEPSMATSSPTVGGSPGDGRDASVFGPQGLGVNTPRTGSGAGTGDGVGSGRGIGARGRGTNAGEPSARSGVGAVAAEEAAIERGTAAARSATGGMGMAPIGARGGNGGEDREHRVPEYLQQADPDEIFGNPERVAPPVIGE